MPKRRVKNPKKRLEQELAREQKKLKNLKLVEPELFRRCGDSPCCQAQNRDGSLCTRPAMTSKTYINRLKCCYLCWQHALSYGVYGLYRLAKLATEAQLDWDSYCVLNPEECEKILNTIGK